MSADGASTRKAVRQRIPSPTPKWIGRGVLSLVLAWIFAHFVTLGSPHWGPGTRHDAVIFGQMIAIGLFPILFLIAFGTKNPVRGAVFVGIACIAAASGLLFER